MKYAIITTLSIAIALFIYWLGGGDFVRGHALSAAFTTGLFAAIPLNTFYWFAKNQIKVRRG